MISPLSHRRSHHALADPHHVHYLAALAHVLWASLPSPRLRPRLAPREFRSAARLRARLCVCNSRSVLENITHRHRRPLDGSPRSHRREVGRKASGRVMVLFFSFLCGGASPLDAADARAQQDAARYEGARAHLGTSKSRLTTAGRTAGRGRAQERRADRGHAQVGRPVPEHQARRHQRGRHRAASASRPSCLARAPDLSLSGRSLIRPSAQLAVRNCFIRGSVVRYVTMDRSRVDFNLLEDASRRGPSSGSGCAGQALKTPARRKR